MAWGAKECILVVKPNYNHCSIQEILNEMALYWKITRNDHYKWPIWDWQFYITVQKGSYNTNYKCGYWMRWICRLLYCRLSAHTHLLQNASGFCGYANEHSEIITVKIIHTKQSTLLNCLNWALSIMFYSSPDFRKIFPHLCDILSDNMRFLILI